jgi:hypothetical protein
MAGAKTQDLGPRPLSLHPSDLDKVLLSLSLVCEVAVTLAPQLRPGWERGLLDRVGVMTPQHCVPSAPMAGYISPKACSLPSPKGHRKPACSFLA